MIAHYSYLGITHVVTLLPGRVRLKNFSPASICMVSPSLFSFISTTP